MKEKKNKKLKNHLNEKKFGCLTKNNPFDKFTSLEATVNVDKNILLYIDGLSVSFDGFKAIFNASK